MGNKTQNQKRRKRWKVDRWFFEKKAERETDSGSRKLRIWRSASTQTGGKGNDCAGNGLKPIKMGQKELAAAAGGVKRKVSRALRTRKKNRRKSIKQRKREGVRKKKSKNTPTQKKPHKKTTKKKTNKTTKQNQKTKKKKKRREVGQGWQEN